MIEDAKLLYWLWGDAVETVCYLCNCVLIGLKGLTLEEAYSGKRPDISHLRAYGCLAYVYILAENRVHKMELRAVYTCLIGYMPTSWQYKLYKPANLKVIVLIALKIVKDKRVEITW